MVLSTYDLILLCKNRDIKQNSTYKSNFKYQKYTQTDLLLLAFIARVISLCKFMHQKLHKLIGWFGLWCLTPLSTIFQLYRGGQFY